VLASFRRGRRALLRRLRRGVAVPASEAEVAALSRRAPAVLPIGAQSSLTGGATPTGESSSARRVSIAILASAPTGSASRPA
jgi:FAD/FMN-containing dehydrogenase